MDMSKHDLTAMMMMMMMIIIIKEDNLASHPVWQVPAT
jgi:hypothetical protein